MSTHYEENEQHEEGKIDIIRILSAYFRAFSRMWIWVLIFAAAGGLILGIRGWRSWSPVYTASATFTVTINNDNGTSMFYNNTTADQMAKTFPYILTSGVLSKKAAESMGEQTLPGSITASAEENTNLFTMSVTDSDPKRAYKTLQAVIKCYPDVAELIIGRTNMDMIDETGVPIQPDNPRDLSGNVKKGAAGGALIGLLWTGITALSRSTIRRKEDVPSKAHMKCIGEIPQITAKKRSSEVYRALNILKNHTDRRFTEAIRQVQSKAEYSARRHQCNIILITSALAGEGKSTIAVNLALAMAKSGKKTVLIDCDLRHPSDRQILGLEPGPGLYEVLKGEAALEDVVINNVAADQSVLPEGETLSFTFVPGGKDIEDGSGLLGTEKMKEIISIMHSDADYVILDSAPAGMITDAGVLAQFVDSVLFVIRKDHADTAHIMRGLEELSQSRAYLIGGILNGV